MTIQKVWPLGLQSFPVDANGNAYLTSPDAAALDASLQRSVDKSYLGGTTAGNLALGKDAVISLDSAGAKFHASNGIATSNGGRVRCGNGDYPEITIDRTPITPFLESFSNLAGIAFQPLPIPVHIFEAVNRQWNVNDGYGTLSPGVGGSASILPVPNSVLSMPLTRMHDGATLFSVTTYFVVSGGRTVLPARYPCANVIQFDPFLGQATSICGGWTFYPTPANITAYINGGHYNSLTCTVTSGPIDVSKYLYFLALLDEDYAGETALGTPNQYVGAAPSFESTDLRFQ